MRLRLHNGHRVVRLQNSVRPQFSRLPGGVRSPIPINWRQMLRPDVVKFAEDASVPATSLPSLLRNPAKYLCRPSNVPLHMRKQVFLPNIVVTLLRTPHLSPKYASFYVPLWFSKLDMKDFLKRVYDVQVLHVRSYVEQQPVIRTRALLWSSNGGRGRLRRPTSKKKMTVELLNPFVWPKEITDLAPWEKEQHDMSNRETRAESQSMEGLAPVRRERRLIAEQAKALLNGEAKWRPTWQALPVDTYLQPGKDSRSHFGP